jgi:hypothetical protein
MSWRAVGLVLATLTFAVVGMTSVVVAQSMVDEVNQKRPPEDRISPYGWYPGRLLTVVSVYRQVYPNGRRHIQVATLAVVAAIGFVLGAACILFPA